MRNSCLLYDAQFFSVTIYKVGKCLILSVLKSEQMCSVVYTSIVAASAVIILTNNLNQPKLVSGLTAGVQMV